MRVLLSILILMVLLNIINASLNIKFGSCTGTCYCASDMIEKYETSSQLTVKVIPDYPQALAFDDRFNVSWMPSTKKMVFGDLGSSFTIQYKELAYPINSTDNSYGKNCAYIIDSSTGSNSCFYNVFCNTDQSSDGGDGSTSTSSAISLSLSLFLFSLIISLF